MGVFFEVWLFIFISDSSICKGELDTEICYLREGDAFDLGDRVVTAYDLPGHTVGHMVFIDSGSRIAFTGDSVNYNNGTNFHAASTHIRYLEKLLAGYGKTYDRIFTGHTTYCGLLNVIGHNVKIVYNLAEAYRALLRGEAEVCEVTNHLFPEMKKKVVIYGTDDVFDRCAKNPMVMPDYPPSLWEENEEHIIP